MLCTAQEQALNSINSIRVNITGYCLFHGMVEGHIPFSNEGQTQESLGTAALGITRKGVFRPRQTRQLPRAVDLKGRLLSCHSY